MVNGNVNTCRYLGIAEMTRKSHSIGTNNHVFILKNEINRTWAKLLNFSQQVNKKPKIESFPFEITPTQLDCNHDISSIRLFLRIITCFKFYFEFFTLKVFFGF